jgi:hypothetical protein
MNFSEVAANSVSLRCGQRLCGNSDRFGGGIYKFSDAGGQTRSETKGKFDKLRTSRVEIWATATKEVEPRMKTQ